MIKVANSQDVFLLGRQPAANTTEYPLWYNAGVYTWPTAAMGMEVVSSSANDAAAGTGARTVKVTYLDGNFVVKSETITLNGTTAVATIATDIYRILDFRVMTTGTGLKSAGTIDIRNLADTPIYARIITGDNEAQQAIYTVPADKFLILYKGNIGLGSSAAGKYGIFKLLTNYNHVTDTIDGYGASGVMHCAWQMLTMDSAVPIDFTCGKSNGLIIPSKADVMMTVIGTAAGLANAWFKGELIDAGEINSFKR